MVYKIIWSKRSKANLKQILDFLYEEWGEIAVNNFFEKLAKTISTLEIMPNSGKKYREDKSIRGIGISKQTTLYYKKSEDTIKILTLFNNRQNPKNTKL